MTAKATAVSGIITERATAVTEKARGYKSLIVDTAYTVRALERCGT